jgi:hypothetical protein
MYPNNSRGWISLGQDDALGKGVKEFQIITNSQWFDPANKQ